MGAIAPCYLSHGTNVLGLIMDHSTSKVLANAPVGRPRGVTAVASGINLVTGCISYLSYRAKLSATPSQNLTLCLNTTGSKLCCERSLLPDAADRAKFKVYSDAGCTAELVGGQYSGEMSFAHQCFHYGTKWYYFIIAYSTANQGYTFPNNFYNGAYLGGPVWGFFKAMIFAGELDDTTHCFPMTFTNSLTSSAGFGGSTGLSNPYPSDGWYLGYDGSVTVSITHCDCP